MLSAMTSLVDRAAALLPLLAGQRAHHDAHRQLAPAVVDALRTGGMLTALVPRELGGHALAPRDYVLMLEALARGDSATAWVVMTASTSTLLAAYLPRPTAARLWATGQPAPLLAGIFAPTGQITIEGDVARLTGRWSWASGSRHADWFVVGALDGRHHQVCFVPPAAVHVVDNWDPIGLAGTGSHDLVIEGAVLPTDQITSVFERAPWTDAPLYRVPMFGLLALGIAGCGLGIARAALAQVEGTLTPDAPSTTWATYADLRARLGAARAYVLATADAALAAATAGVVPGPVRGELRLAACHAAATSAEVARAAFHLGGGASVRAGSAASNALRDLETVLTHRMVADRVRPAAARAALAIGTTPPDL